MTAKSPAAGTGYNQQHDENENDEWRKLFIALIFLLLSFACIFCSSQSALWRINKDHIEGNMLSTLQADYGRDGTALAPLSDAIAAEAARDEQDLLLSRTPVSAGLGVAVLPNPVPTPPVVVTPLPPIPTPTSSVSEPSPPSTPIAEVPTPTERPTDESQPEPTDQPTAVPTQEPTAVPTQGPTAAPTVQPTDAPTPQPTDGPSEPDPTSTPSDDDGEPEPLPQASFAAARFTAGEADGSAIITVILDSTSAQTITVKYATSDRTATAGSDYTATSGRLTFAPGQTSQTFSIAIIDDPFGNEGIEKVRLTLSNPKKATLGSPNPATLRIVDDEGQPTVQFSNSSYSIDEANGPATMTVTLSVPSALTVKINYVTSNGTAMAGSDYTPTSNTLTFAPGQTSRTFSVPITDDMVNEAVETIVLGLNTPVNATLGSPSSATLSIVDDDPVTVQFSSSSYSVLENAGPAVITVTLSLISEQTITVTYVTSNGTAMAGSDYTPTSNTLTFAPGQTSRTFTVPITDDMVNEAVETIVLGLNTPVNATLGSPSSALLSIVDDDPVTVQFSSSSYSVLENAGPAVITVTLSLTSEQTITVTYATREITATAGSDYVDASGPLTFVPGQITQTFAVAINNDGLQEPNETVQLILSAPTSGATLGTPNPAVLTILDDGDSGGCPGSNPPGEPEIIPPASGPDGAFLEVGCGSAVVVDLGITIIDTTTPDSNFDIVFYERGQPDPPTSTTHIFMDWVIVQIGTSPSGPWYDVFYWGDGIVDNNANVGAVGLPEIDNRVISTTLLFGTAPYTTGITIDVDNPNPAFAPSPPPPDLYQYVRFIVPPGGDNDVVEVDAVERLP